MRRIVYLVVLFAALSTPSPATDITPQALNAFIQQRDLGTALTQEEWCQLALLAMTSPKADEQTRTEINVMARNRNCYTEAHPAEDEATRARSARPFLLFSPNRG
jgi:hypothetical protein